MIVLGSSSTRLFGGPDEVRRRLAVLRTNGSGLLGVIASATVVGVAAGRDPLLGLGLVIVLGGALVVLLWPAIAVYLLPIVPVLSGLGRGVPVPGFRVSEVLTVWVGATLIVRGSMSAESRPPRWQAFDWIALLYALAAVGIPLYDVFVGGMPAGPSAPAVFGPLQYIIYYRAAVICLDTRKRRLTALRVLLLSSCLTNIFAVMQAVRVPGVRPLINSLIGLDPYATAGYVAVPRATGLFSHWHVLAGFDTAIVLIIVALLLGGRSALPRLLALIAAGLAVAGIAVSVTSTTMIGVVVGAVVIGLLTGRIRVILFWIVTTGAVVGALIWPLITARIAAQSTGSGSILPQTIAYRGQIWSQQYYPAILHRPITGYGPQLPTAITWPYPENVYLSLLTQGGVLLLGVYLVWTAALLRLSLHASRPRTQGEDGVVVAVARALFALLAALTMMQMLFPYMLTSGLPGLVWLLTAIIVRDRSAATDHRPEQRVYQVPVHLTEFDRLVQPRT